jgi:hypothetical protein
MSDADLVSPRDIAVLLGIANQNGRPHAHAIAAILSDIGVKPAKIRGPRKFLYYRSCIQKVRFWFYEEVGIGFNRPVRVGHRTFNVRYLPDDDLSLNDLEEIVA